MQNRGKGPRTLGRLFVTHAAVSLVPVLALGGVLAWSYQGEARQRGVAEGRSEAILVAQTAVEPLLDARPLAEGLSQYEKTELNLLVARAVGEHHVLRLRLRDLNGQVVYSDDGSGFSQRPEDEALEAAHGEVVARLTHLNTDANDSGRAGVAAVEVYQPLTAGPDDRVVGVLELYLPYAPISSDVTAGLHRLYVDLGIGLALLYLALFAISASVSRGLRREVKLTTFLADHDPLTELPNRAMFHRRAADSLERSRRSGRQVAVAIFDLDRFKEVNDTLGHHNGDKLLVEIARRLDKHIGRHDTVARLGGDEFGVILSDAVDAEATLWRLREVINQEIEVSGLPLSIDASIGFSIAAEDGNIVDDLVQHADVAMYVAKTQHAGVTRYTAELDHYDTANLALIAELRHAIDADQLTLHYQPKASIADNRVEAVEALVRWQHPAHGLLYPDRFIPLAEQTDLIDALTAWVLTTALTEIRDLGAGFDLPVAVNVSARNFSRDGFADQVISILNQVDVGADRLIIEITETALLTDPARAGTALAELAAVGVRSSLDDFGQGHTSLGYLSQLPLNEVKIDKGFVTDMLTDPSHVAIVRSIIDLGHNLAFRVVAEGVETEDVLSSLKALGCDVAQGYLLARPMPLDDLQQWLTSTVAVPTATP